MNMPADRFSASILPSLGLMFGHLFMWSNNVHMFSGIALCVSAGMILALALLLFLCNYYLAYRVISCFPTERLKNILFSAYTALLFVFVTWCIIHYFPLYNKNHVYSPIIAVICFLAFYLLRTKIFCIFMCVMLLFSLFTFGKNILNDKFEEEISLKTDLVDTKFVSKPNIYLFWLESYHDFDVLKKVYGLEDKELETSLVRHKFTMGKNIYSSGEYTLKAFTQLFSCGLIEDPKSIGNLDTSTQIRRLIGGDANNILLRTLKNNLYHTILITGGSDYYAHDNGVHLDEIDIVSTVSVFSPLMAISQYSNKLYEILKGSAVADSNGYHGNLLTRVRIAMQRGKESGNPYFISFKGGVQHTPSDGTYIWKNRTSWMNSKAYPRLFPDANREIQEIIDYIISNDPAALIIMLGDHGAVTFRDIEWGSKNLFTSCATNNIDILDVLDDRFRVFFAYRLPHGEQADLSHGMYMNNLNIFVHVFAWLAQDESILKHRKRSVSRLGNAVLTEGQLQPQP